MKKTISLIIAIVLSLTVFVSDIAGIAMVVRASDEEVDELLEEDFIEPVEEPVLEPTEAPAPEPTEPPAPEPTEAPPAPEPDPTPTPEPVPTVDPAAEEAARKAAEAEEAARKAAEEAAKKKAAEEAAQNYSLVITMGGSPVSSIDFGTAGIGEERDYKEIYVTNTGSTAFDLITTKNGDADGAFSLVIKGDKTHYEPGDSGKLLLSMRSDLGAGTYECMYLFGAKIDPSYSRALGLKVKGTVASKPAGVQSVELTPSHVVLSTGTSWEFYADVRGVGDYDSTVLWSVTGARSVGTSINNVGPTGILNVASDETSTNLTVIATSKADPSINDYATVTLQKDSYNVMVVADPSSGGKVTGGGAVLPGGSVTVSAVPNRNYVFKGWVVDGKTVSTSTNYTIYNIQSDMKVTAKFEQNMVSVRLDVNDSDGGSVSGGGTYSYGDTATVTAKAYSGYTFTGWKENGNIVSRDSSIKLKNLTVDRRLTAVFKKTRYTINLVANPSNGGDVSGGGTYNLGDSTTIKASPRAGYDFAGWYVNGQTVSRDKEYRIDKIEQDYTITAAFQQQGIVTYEVSSGVATTGGSISPSGKIYAVKGSNLTYTITPKTGFAILAVAVDGVQVGPVSSYTFSNITGPHMIAAAFVQTDAGKKAAESTGAKPQETKVQVIPKSESNTATDTSTVNINEAANGEGGDNYVEEMNLDDVHIPSDEELGITVESETEESTDVSREMGISMSEISGMISTGNTMPILDAAFYTGGLGAYVYNKFEPASMNSIDYNKLSKEELMTASDDQINPSLPDLDVVVQKMLTTDDVMRLAKGDKIDISVSITGEDKPDAASEKIMKNAVGHKPVKYFDVTMLKSMGGSTEKITELPTTMEVIIEIPDDVYQKGKTYSVLRVHNGELTVLPDLDDDPKTITFKTDRFSSYAIAREVATASSLVTGLAVGALLAFGVAVTCLAILIIHQRKMRKMKRKAA